MDLFFYSIPGIRASSLSLLIILTKLKFYSLSRSSISKQIRNVIFLSLSIKINIIFLESLKIQLLHPKLYISCIIDGMIWPFFRVFMDKIRVNYNK